MGPISTSISLAGRRALTTNIVRPEQVQADLQGGVIRLLLAEVFGLLEWKLRWPNLDTVLLRMRRCYQDIAFLNGKESNKSRLTNHSQIRGLQLVGLWQLVLRIS